ncbi:MAG: biotin--[acetyl-CoA-carboxylase] ligase [Candidatus Verstraetearchaeota archaeon]|nr:biotin--[acetyl-CoA-carboxylase] ligase [Candidatus Verstraetearchaeota archaeon]
MLYDFLLSSDFISGEEIAKRLNISRVAVHKKIQNLRKQGYIIEGIRGKGYRVIPRFDGLLPLELKLRLKTKIFGKEIITLESIDSTQRLIKELAEKGFPEGTLVIALEQTNGKGRMNRKWYSPRGGLWFSLLLRPLISPKDIYKLSLLFGVAITTSLEYYGIKASLKWPNDIIINNRKLCGILLEGDIELDKVNFVTVGIGINANFPSSILPDDLKISAISLYDILGKNIDRAELLCKILENSENLYIQAINNGFSNIISLWRSKSSIFGKSIEVKLLDRSIKGIAIDIDDDGSLILNQNGKIVKIYSGDVILL